MARIYKCNMCGEIMKYSGVLFKGVFPYGSRYDGDTFEIDLCPSCIDKLTDNCKISPSAAFDGETVYAETM